MKILTARLNEHKMSESGPKSYLVQLYYYCTYLNDYCKIERGVTINKILKNYALEKDIVLYFYNYCCLD